jgi:hypothetical protein
LSYGSQQVRCISYGRYSKASFLDKLARRLGYGAKKKLHRDGMVRDRGFVEKLLGNWSQF